LDRNLPPKVNDIKCLKGKRQSLRQTLREFTRSEAWIFLAQIKHICELRTTEPVFVRVKAHSGILLNEEADRQAGVSSDSRDDCGMPT
jgi:hypothetical protein